tara:strand:+ start:416 stop:823 length:408 start_codon:yes stop_codon:yes gene_type:complete
MKSFEEWKEKDLDNVDEALSMSQRLQVGRRMARMSHRIQRSKKIKQRRMADRDQLTKRAVKAARNILTKKLMGGKGKSELNIAQRIAVSKKLEKKSAVIKKLSKKLFPKIMKAEKERLKAFKSKKTETPGQTKKL